MWKVPPQRHRHRRNAHLRRVPAQTLEKFDEMLAHKFFLARGGPMRNSFVASVTNGARDGEVAAPRFQHYSLER